MTINVQQATPTIMWSNPADILYGTVLSATQLDAAASYTVGGASVSVLGTFVYTPAAGTVLNVGNGQTLSVSFTPVDTTDYTAARAMATVNVLAVPVNLDLTRTDLRAKPRPATIGRRVTLTATIKDLTHGGGTPSGSVTFMDGTDSLGTVALLRGKASLETSSLHIGPNTIHAEYLPGQGFAPSGATVIENVRVHRSRSKAAPSTSAAKPGALSAPIVMHVGRPAYAMTRDGETGTGETGTQRGS